MIFWRRVGLFEIVSEPVRGVFVTDVEDGLDRTSFAQEFDCFISVFEREGGLVFSEICVGLRAARFEECDFEASFGEALASPSAGGTGADDDCVKLSLCGSWQAGPFL